MAIAILSLFLALPIYALSRLTVWIDWRLLAGAPLGLSLITYFAYRSDKRRAETKTWRIPEFTLHAAELLGGWPGAFLAQRKFRHKIAKPSYQMIYWIVVLAHQFVALDFLLGWRLSRDALRFISY